MDVASLRGMAGRAHVTPVDFCSWLKVIVTALVMKPGDISVVELYQSDGKLALQMTVAPGDRGRVIGKAGGTIDGLRAVAAAAGGRHGLRVTLDLNDEARGQ
jgi:predicted RNA-binding protein YlqC (UPF0109 family)